MAYTISDEPIPKLEMFTSKEDDELLVFKVGGPGHIQEADLLRAVIIYFCFSYSHDHVSPCDDGQIPSIPGDSEWER